MRTAQPVEIPSPPRPHVVLRRDIGVPLASSHDACATRLFRDEGSAPRRSEAEPLKEKVSRDHFPGATKPYEVVPILGSEPVTVCGPEVLGTVDPGAAPKDAVLSLIRPSWDLAS